MLKKVRGVFFLVLLLLSVSCEQKKEAVQKGKVDEVASVSVRFPTPIIESGQKTFYAAQNKGYCKNENLDVKFEMGSKELKAIAIIHRKSNFPCLMGLSLIRCICYNSLRCYLTV